MLGFLLTKVSHNVCVSVINTDAMKALMAVHPNDHALKCVETMLNSLCGSAQQILSHTTILGK